MMKFIDGKSFLIGFLLAMVIALLLGSGSSSGVQEVRIVGISGHDSLSVKLENPTLKMEIVDIKYGLELPVLIKK